MEYNFIQTPSPTESSFSQASSTASAASSSTSTSSFDYFMLDPSAREHVRGTLSADEKIEHAWLACSVCVDGIRKKEMDSANLSEIHDFGRIMAPHAKICYEDWSRILETRSDDDDVAWQVLGNVCMTQGALQQAIGCFELALRQKAHMDPIERIQTSLSLASLLQQDDQVQRSREVLSDIDIPSIDRALSFRVALAKASASAAEGQLAHAENQYETIEQQQEEALGPTDVNTVATVQKLAVTLEQMGKMEEAEALYRRVYISYQNHFGQSHPITLEAMEDLAHVLRVSNAVDEAEKLYKQSVEIKTRTLGQDHPSTAHAIQKLAVLDDSRFRYADAQKKYQQALDIMLPTLGRAHPLYTTTLENMALSARFHGHSLSEEALDEGDITANQAAAQAYDLAEKLYREVVVVRNAANTLYSVEQVLDTGSKLREMYETEEFYAEKRGEKVMELLALLKEGRKKGSQVSSG